MAEENQDRPAKRKKRVVQPEGTPSFYSNNVYVSVSPWDMRLQFTIIDKVDDSEVVYRAVANVYLAPGQARAIRKILTEKAAVHDAIWTQQEAIVTTVGKDDETEEEG